MSDLRPIRVPVPVVLLLAVWVLGCAGSPSYDNNSYQNTNTGNSSSATEDYTGPAPSPKPSKPERPEYVPELDKTKVPAYPLKADVTILTGAPVYPEQNAEQFWNALQAKYEVASGTGAYRGDGTNPYFESNFKLGDQTLLLVAEQRIEGNRSVAHGLAFATFNQNRRNETYTAGQHWGTGDAYTYAVGYFRYGKMHGPWAFNSRESAKKGGENILYSICEYQYGRANGEYQSWAKDGSHATIEFYKGGEREGISTYWSENGVWENEYVGGDNFGAHRVWNKQGQLIERTTRYRGNKFGKVEKWYPGSGMSYPYSVHYASLLGTEWDKGWYTFYDKEGRLGYQSLIDGSYWTGPHVAYHPNGSPKVLAYQVKGRFEGAVEYYYDNGRLQEKSEFKNGNRNGERIRYNALGEVLEHAVYKDNLVVENLLKPDSTKPFWPQPTVVNGPDGKPIKRTYGRWRIETQDDGPPMVYGVAMAYHEKLGGVVMFGGVNTAEDSREGTAETWLRKDGKWQRIFKDGPAPAARDYAAMAYDAERGVIVLFGGRLKGSAALGDTWELGVGGWQQFVTTPKMDGRKSASLVYDKNRQGCVLIGGVGKDSSGKEVTRSETYIWNGTEWKKLGVGPAVHSAAACYDEQRGCIVVHGGFEGGRVRADNWVLADGATQWNQVKVSTLVAYDHAMVYDSDARAALLLMKDGLADPPRFTARVIEDFGSWISWTEVPSLPQPYERLGFGAAYDRNTREIVIYGGRALKSSNWVGFKETLVLTDETREDRAADTADFARVKLQAPGWSLIDNGDFSGSKFYHENLVYDGNRKAAVMIGQHLGQSTMLEVYEFKDGAWKATSPSTAPAVRSACACWYDAERGVVRMFGGVYGKQSFADLWEWDGRNWTRETEQVPGAPRVTPETIWAWDPVRRVLVGLIDAVDYCQVYEFDGKKWKDTGVRQPVGFGGNLIFDPHKKMVLLSNPIDLESYSVLPKAWHWDGKSWLEAKDIMQGPDHDAGFPMHADPVTGAIWQFCGYIRMFDGKEWKAWESPEGLDNGNPKIWADPETGTIHVHGTYWFVKDRRNDTLVFDPERGEQVK